MMEFLQGQILEAEYIAYGLLFVAGFTAWTISTLSAGGGELLLVPVITFITGQGPAPIATITNLTAEPARILAFRRDVDWTIVRWYLPGAVAGAILGGWLFVSTKAEWVQVFVGLYLITTVWSYRGGKRQRTYKARLWYFLPAGVFVSFISAFIGSVGPILNTLYLNYGAEKEALIATKSVNSFVMQLVKVGTYTTLGALNTQIFLYGLSAGLGAASANWIAKRWLKKMSGRQFRTFVVGLMAISGIVMIWKQHEVVLAWFQNLTG